MAKIYTEAELRALGMSDLQIKGIMQAQSIAIEVDKEENKRLQFDQNEKDMVEASDFVYEEKNSLPINIPKVVQLHQHNVDVNVPKTLVPTSVNQIATYKDGVVVELPPFADGQPFVVRMIRPSMLALVKCGKIPNSLLNQATSLFANGAGALNAGGKNSANVSELFDVIDVIVESALLEPTLKEIRSVGMELTDDQLMAIFSYTQRGVKALEQFRTK